MGGKIVVDDFLEDFESFREHCDSLDYAGAINPADGVLYPGISLDIPAEVRREVVQQIERQLGVKIIARLMFLRLSPEGTPAPHQAHTDTRHSRYGLMLYLNRMEDCIGGTSFVRHKATGMVSDPINEKQLEAWTRDHSRPLAWDVVDMCQMFPNRGCIFTADRMHRSEPVGGFGNDSTDGRLVLVCFFDLKEGNQ